MKKLKNLFIRNRKNFIIASGIILFLVGISNIYIVVNVRAISNDECLWHSYVRNDTMYIYFGSVKENGVTWNAGIRDKDELIAINDIKLQSTTQAQVILNAYESGEYAKYTIKKGDRVINTNVYVKKLINFGNLAFSLLALIWLVIGFIVVLAKPEGEVQRVFYRIGMVTVIWLSSTFVSAPPVVDTRWIITTVQVLSSIAVIYLPFLVIYFFWIFPRPFAFIQKKWVKRTFYSLPLLVVLLVYGQRFLFVSSQKDLANLVRNFEILIGNILPISLIAGLISLLISYFRIKQKEERKPLFSILFAFIIGVASIIYTSAIAPAISDTIFNSPELYTPIVLITVLPISFAFSIFRYQLMDVTIVVKNTIIYGAATILLAAIYFALIYFIGQSVSTAIGTEYQGFIAGLVFILFAILFQSTKNKMQDFLTARFYPEQFAYQKVILGFSKEISTVVGLNNILDTMTRTFVDALMIKHFGIALRKEGTDDLVLHRSIGISDKKMIIQVENLSYCIAEKASILKMPACEQSEFSLTFPENAEKLIGEGIYTVIPMVVKSKVVGALYFGLKHSGSQFEGKDLELLLASANQAAIAIENARLYQSEAEKQRIERDLEVARKIQEGLLPQTIPFIKGLDISGRMKPAQQVGGDYYDLIMLSPTKIFVAVGDVSGKGLSASLYMTKLQTLIQFACTPNKTPKEILIELNKKLYDLMERNWFITLTLALFDMDEKTITFCRAGHMPVLKANNGYVESYRTKGLGLGLENGIIFEASLCEQLIELKPNQIFAFFSDGITEAMNESYELFGENNLVNLLKDRNADSSGKIIEDIWNSVNSFKGEADQYDDMTMVLVKVTDM